MNISKFRVWDKKVKTWLDYEDIFISQEGEVCLIEERNWGYVTYMHKENITERVSIARFTGIHDRQGKAIYEGDIIKIGDYPPYEVIVNPFSMIHCIDNELGQEELFKHHKNCRIIGNIYENLELLEVKE